MKKIKKIKKIKKNYIFKKLKMNKREFIRGILKTQKFKVTKQS